MAKHRNGNIVQLVCLWRLPFPCGWQGEFYCREVETSFWHHREVFLINCWHVLLEDYTPLRIQLKIALRSLNVFVPFHKRRIHYHFQNHSNQMVTDDLNHVQKNKKTIFKRINALEFIESVSYVCQHYLICLTIYIFLNYIT